MSFFGHHSTASALAVVTLLTVFPFVSSQSSVAQDAGAPPWGEFLRRFNRDPLLKKPFHMDPAENVKGLASKIRARELDIPNRKRAIRYLADLDCTQFPEAKAMLLKMLDPNEEKWEEVRFEAARGLRDMLARHSCNPNAANGKGNGKDKGKGGSKGSADSSQCKTCNNGSSCESCQQSPSVWQQCSQAASKATRKMRGQRPEPQEPPCHCRSCCDADTLNLLAKTAYELKEDGCCYEPSRRVREMAVEAINACGVPCNFGPYYGDGGEPGPPPMDESSDGSGSNGEVVPPSSDESVPAPAPSDSVKGIEIPSAPSLTAIAPISRLTHLCIVSLKDGKQVAPSEQFSATYRGRIYYFASDNARQKFEASPEQYAVAFGGCDPVHFVETREAVEGRFLAQHSGRFYMFTSKENHERFKANPDRYSKSAGRTAAVASRN